MTRLRASAPTEKGKVWLIALFGYATLTAVGTWPLVLRLTSTVAHDPGDPLLSTWILWWNAHSTPLTSAWWNAPTFWPLRGSLAVSEHLLGVSLLTTPMQWLGADPVAAYNTAFFLSFPMSAMAAHALAYSLTQRHDASAVAGTTFGFNPYRMSQAAHIQMLWTFWMPLALLALHRYARDRRPRWLVMFALMWIGQAASNAYLLLFFPVLLALWLAWFVASRRDLRLAAAIGVAWACGCIALLPAVLPYVRLNSQFALERTYDEIRVFSAEFASFASASPLVAASAFLPAGSNAERHLFPGFTVVTLIAVAAALSLRRHAVESRRGSWTPMVFASAAGIALVVAASLPVVGPWRIAAGALTIVSVTSAMKPLTIALWCAVFAVATAAPFARAWRARSPLAFYAIAAIVLYAFSLGPAPALFGVPFWYRPPYAWLLELPGYVNVRAPARFAILAILCLSVAAAMAFDRIRALMPRRYSAAIAAAVLSAAVADGWLRELPLAPVPASIASLDAVRDGAVVELPIGDVLGDTAALYRSMRHRRPLVNGYGGFQPAHYAILRYAADNGDPDAVRTIAAYGPLTVVDGRRLLTIPRAAPDPAPHGTPLPILSAAVNGAPIDLVPITDARRGSRWDSGTSQNGGESMVIDLGADRTVDGVVLSLGAFIFDYPRAVTVDVSEDSRSWTTKWSGRGAAKAVAGAILDPSLVPLSFGFTPSRARWIRIRQLGADRRAHWSVAELTVTGR